MYRVVAACLAILTPVAASAQGLGEAEYMNSCAQCHGPGGQGDGVMSGFLTTAAPDLTTLQSDNDGVFPFARVYGIVDGSVETGAHGTSEMPAWGQRYRAEAPEALGWEYGRTDEDAFVRARILALVEYISTLQEE